MKRTGKWVEASEAIKVIQPSHRIIIPIGCGLPTVLIREIIAQKERLKGLEIVGGLQVNYPFLADGLSDFFVYRTWQCSPAIKNLVRENKVKYVPMRQGEVPAVFSPSGVWPVDVALIHVSKPDPNGYCSLGVSISHSLPASRNAKIVIAEVNDKMPRVLGENFIHVSNIDYLVGSAERLLEYPAPKGADGTDSQIAQKVSNLIEDGSTLQVGIGTIPELILGTLGDRKNLRIFALGVDGVVELAKKGAVEAGFGKIVVCEMLGTKKLFDFIDDNPQVEGKETSRTINPLVIAQIQKFVSIISAIEVDLTGQANLETIGGQQMSAVGGSFDFLQGSLFSPGGKSIIALPSTTPDGKISRISSRLAAGSAITIPRHSVQYIVTEYGVASLWGKSIKERMEELIAIANPKFRPELEVSLGRSHI